MNSGPVTSRALSSAPARRGRIAAISGVGQHRPIVMVLGMHRSGTSLCSHILSMLGVDMADRIPGPGLQSSGPDNPRGHWERWEIVGFHDRILDLFNRGYYTPFHDFALPAAWWADPRVAEIRREMVGFLETRMGEGPFGFKDPRTIRLMPVWHQILDELKLAPKIVLCLRNPAQVARSVTARDGFAAEMGEYRWFIYMVDFFRYTGSFEVCTVEYESWFDKPAANLEKLQQFLALPWQQTANDLDVSISELIDQELRHDDSQRREARYPLVRSLYQLCSDSERDASARDRIDAIVSQFVRFQQFQRPFQHAFEESAALAARLREVQHETAVALGQRDALLGERQRDHDAALRAVRAELETARAEASRAELAALASADARLQQAEEAAATRIEALRNRVAGAERDAHENRLAADARAAELAALRDELGTARKVARAALAALRGELTSPPGPAPAASRRAGWTAMLGRFLSRTTRRAAPNG